MAPDSTHPGNCPDASKLGTATLRTPLIDHSLEGQVYLGTPDCSPCSDADAAAGKLIHLYIEIDDPATGVVVKLPGSATADPATGQLTATFKDNPQFPFEDLQLHFKSGARAPLTTPAVCGTYNTTTELTPWSAPETEDAHPGSSFAVSSGCAPSAAQMPNNPAFSAGTASPIGGSYSPFVLKLSRENGSQAIKGLDLTLPPGLTGKLAGIPYCSEAQIAAARNHSGAAEKAAPSCPAASEVGTVTIGAGSGNPFYVGGHAYLAGPYKGAPVSMAILTPALAGPFDLGTVVVRAGLYVDRETAAIHAVSDPLPAIERGVPFDIRSLALQLDRPRFTLNPTSCDPLAIAGQADSAAGSGAPVSTRFQVGGCSALPFKPKVAVRFSGPTHRGAHPGFRTVLTARAGDANPRRIAVTLPATELLDNRHIGSVCAPARFVSADCPASSVYGHAKVWTPLLSQPLEGPVFLRTSDHKLPDLVASLHGPLEGRPRRPDRFGAGPASQLLPIVAGRPPEQGRPQHARRPEGTAREHRRSLRTQAAGRRRLRRSERKDARRHAGGANRLSLSALAGGGEPLDRPQLRTMMYH